MSRAGPPSTGRGRAPQLVFLHIPKNAGTSIKRFILQGLGEEAVFSIRPRPPFIEDLPSRDLARYQAIIGHIPFHHAHWGLTASKNRLPNPMRILRRPPRIYCAVLRRPRAFIRSNFDYVNQRPGHAWKTSGSLPEAIAGREKFARRMNNLQCYYLSGRRKAAPALRALNRYPFIVGTLDRLDLFIDEISRRYGIQGPVPTANVTEAKSELPSSDIPGLEPLIAEDRKLYDFVRTRGLFISPTVDQRAG